MQQSGSNNNHGSQASNFRPQSNIPVPIPRINSRPVRKVNLLTSDPNSDTDTKLLNCFDDEFVTHGYISNIYTSIIVNSGAKRSLVSSNFITPTCHLSSKNHCVAFLKSFPSFLCMNYPLTFQLSKVLLGLPSLPNITVLLGIDFGKEKFVELINSIKQVPGSELSVTRAMCAEQELADQVSEALHQSEGANPLPLADIPAISELYVSDTADTE